MTAKTAKTTAAKTTGRRRPTASTKADTTPKTDPTTEDEAEAAPEQDAPDPTTEDEAEAAPEQDAPDTTDTKKAPTKAEAVRAFEEAFEAAVEEGSDDRIATATEALRAVPGGPKAREAVRSAAVAATVTKALPTDGTAPDVDLATRATSVGSALAASMSAPAPEKGPDLADVMAARVAALARIGHDLLGWAADNGLSVDDDTSNALNALTAGDQEDPDATWKKAFGSKRPNLEKVPGRRSGGGSGGGMAARPSDALDAFEVGTELTFEYKGRGLHATVTANKKTGRNEVTFRDDSYRSPTKAATVAIATHPEAPESPSVNGWDTWKTADGGQTLAEAYEARVAQK